MDIFKLVFIAVITTAMCLVLKQSKPELSLMVALAGGILIFLFSLDKVSQIIDLIKELSSKSGIPNNFLSILLKIIGISYITEFSANICKDAGESAIASKIQFAGKCIILVFGITIISNFVETLVKLV